MGKTGVGKTILLNSLCGTSHKTDQAVGSVTQNLFRNDVNCGGYPFSLIDTPGTDSQTEAYKHAYLLKEALTSCNINTIFIVISFDNRFERMFDTYLEIEQYVCKNDAKIVVMVSHWDMSNNPTRHFREICNLFDDYCSNIICYFQRSASSQVANLMYDCISNMDGTKLEILDDDFFLKFNICGIKGQMKKAFEEYKRKADLLHKECADIIPAVPLSERDDVLPMLIVEFKNQLDLLLEELT
ncbi:unnamed protein product, partial [Didymodactylos carnosus]